MHRLSRLVQVPGREVVLEAPVLLELFQVLEVLEVAVVQLQDLQLALVLARLLVSHLQQLQCQALQRSFPQILHLLPTFPRLFNRLFHHAVFHPAFVLTLFDTAHSDRLLAARPLEIPLTSRHLPPEQALMAHSLVKVLLLDLLPVVEELQLRAFNCYMALYAADVALQIQQLILLI